MANYPECLLCDSKVSEVCGKLYVARGKKPPCARAVVENCRSLQQLKAEIAALVPIVSSIKVSWHDTNKHFFVTERLRQLSAVSKRCKP